ncbi:hypothetical protein FE783_01340 [Paenibacillus mesophilus]|nr:hypothetical protein FE783_01340 [Paenibacillus mesophilus]
MELVGNCSVCQTAVYCKGGFLDGVSDNHILYCHSCYEASGKERQPGSGGTAADGPDADLTGGAADSGSPPRNVPPLRHGSDHKSGSGDPDPA